MYAIAGRALFACLLTFFLASGTSAKSPAQWSDTSPAINLTHIFSGEINRKGKATGFHHFPGGQDLPHVRFKKSLSTPNKAGVYTALIEILDPETGQWKEKFSSLFPDHLKKKQLIAAILNAFHTPSQPQGRKWQGPSGLGFSIAGYILKDGRIITAYPIYKKDE